jgi:sRNA-binding regulator protein Hfq
MEDGKELLIYKHAIGTIATAAEGAP